MKKNRHLLFAICFIFLSVLSNKLAAQTETFEDETNLATTFTTSGNSFSLSLACAFRMPQRLALVAATFLLKHHLA